jgi:hypothetical protein
MMVMSVQLNGHFPCFKKVWHSGGKQMQFAINFNLLELFAHDAARGKLK